ncbi:recombinase family protein [Phenylobacterium sp.]|uniref:recombinase family protein n=1 Tax=Phenylobacterium sp. TaxID=1871053 RepID=UPI00351FA4C7
MRAALYARYSSERQNERSIADQLTVCTRHAQAKGWTVTALFQDAAISGAAMANRPGLLDAIAAAEAREFDILLVEDEDRLARNLEHLAHIAGRLEDAGVMIATLTTDHVQDLHVAFKGLQASMFLKNLAQKTRRGMASNAEKGLATGSRLYGYRTAPGGVVEIVEDQAEIIREIFALYGKGATGREIADQLNRRGVPSPTGGLWNASTINGSRQRGNGILQSEIYAGVKVYGRMDVRKDRATGKRTPRPIPPEQWKRTPVPHLRIIDQAAWEAAAERKTRESANHPLQLANKRKPGIFTGLLKCGLCGASYTAYTGGRLICAAHRERGDVACANRRTVSRADVEATVLDGLRTRLLSPAAIRAYVEAWTAVRARRVVENQNSRQPLEKRLAEVRRGIDRIVDAIASGLAAEAMKAKLQGLETERLELTAKLAEISNDDTAPRLDLHPSAGQGLAKKVEALQVLLASAAIAADDLVMRELVDSVRGLVERIEIRPRTQERGGPVDVILQGTLAPVIFAREPSKSPASSMSLVVAGGGLEPPTCGL